MTDHEKRIREALEAGPTEGPFQVVRGGTYCWDIKTADSYDVATTHGYVRNQVDSLPTANFIAACNPSAIRALLADLDEARAALSSQPSPELAGVSDEAIYAVWVQHCQTPGTTTRQLVCAFARAILALRPQAVPMTGKQARLLSREELAGCCGGCASNSAIETWMRRAIEKFCEVNGITAQAKKETP